MARYRPPEYCPNCGKQLQAQYQDQSNIPVTQKLIGDTFMGYKPCECTKASHNQPKEISDELSGEPIKIDVIKEIESCFQLTATPVTPNQLSGIEGCNHEPLTDTGVGYYHCPACGKGWTYKEWKSGYATSPRLSGIEDCKPTNNYKHCNHHHELTEEYEIVDFGDGEFVANKIAIHLLKALNESGLKTRSHHMDKTGYSWVCILLDGVEIEVRTVNEKDATRTKYNGKTELLIRWNKQKQ